MPAPTDQEIREARAEQQAEAFWEVVMSKCPKIIDGNRVTMTFEGFKDFTKTAFKAGMVSGAWSTTLQEIREGKHPALDRLAIIEQRKAPPRRIRL